MGLFGLGVPELALVAGAAALLFGASPTHSCSLRRADHHRHVMLVTL